MTGLHRCCPCSRGPTTAELAAKDRVAEARGAYLAARADLGQYCRAAGAAADGAVIAVLVRLYATAQAEFEAAFRALEWIRAPRRAARAASRQKAAQ